MRYGTAGMAGSVWDRHRDGQDEHRFGRLGGDGE